MLAALGTSMQDDTQATVRAVRGALLGTAVADALGLPFEGLHAHEVELYGKGLDRFMLAGRTGFVSDDTEQTALVLQSVLRSRGDVHKATRHFRLALLGFFLRLPFAIGLATLRACVRIALCFKQSGVRSAGNGAAMRSAVLGALLADDDAKRRALTRALAMVTHTDPRAVQGALYVAELAALCALRPGEDRGTLALCALSVVQDSELYEAIEGAVLCAGSEHALAQRANRGYVVDSLELACFVFVRSGHAYLSGVRAAVRHGGDTDTNAAIVGGWLGILHGPEALPRDLLCAVAPGPFGVAHLHALADSVATGVPPVYSPLSGLVRNLALMPVVLVHGLGRLLLRHTRTLGLYRAGEARVVHPEP
jgi:ADP-ribosyl-[dinitrogen reductase] hydrolase